MNSRIRYSISLIQSFLLISSFILVFIWILPTFRQYLYLMKQSYSYAYEYDNDVVLNDSYYLLNGTLVYKSNGGSKAELLMQKNVEYSSCSPYSELPAMGEKEIAVSENLLSREQLSIGDCITIYNPLHEGNENYVITHVIDENYGVLTQTIDYSYGVIVLGQESEVISNYSLSSVVFAGDGFSASSNQLSLENLYSREDLLSYCKMQICKFFLIIVVIQLVVQLLSFAVGRVFYSQRLRKHMVEGASLNLLYGFVFSNLVSVSGVAIILAFLVNFGIMVAMIGSGIAAFVLLLCNMIELIIMSSLTLLIAKRSL